MTFIKKFLRRFFTDVRDIEEVAQETFLRAYTAEKTKPIGNPKAFLFRIARNIALTELSKKSRQISEYIDEAHDQDIYRHAATVADELEARQTLETYCEAVMSLPEQVRRAFLLRKVYGMKHKQIATEMEVSLSSVEKYLRRAVLHCNAQLRNMETQEEARGDAAAGNRRQRGRRS